MNVYENLQLFCFLFFFHYVQIIYFNYIKNIINLKQLYYFFYVMFFNHELTCRDFFLFSLSFLKENFKEIFL